VQQQVATTALSDGTQIAYATAGQGPVPLRFSAAAR